jgi:hypothetical protein
MSGGIYLIRNNEELVEMSERVYDSEDLLQRLLARYPNLLAGDQVNSAEPRRWLLVSREAGLPGEEGGGNRWSVDHLFFDQDAVPTIVEVKRSTDTRVRREVVGQMLDYAANAVVYWPVETLQARFEEGREDAEQDLFDFLDGETEPETFWQKAKTNLQAGRVRLIFVADEIPTELRRIVEFLNQQMNPAEMLAVEIKQYVNEDSNLRTLVPRVIGQTAEAQQKKFGTAREGRQWDDTSFFQDLESRRGADEANIARKILEWAETNKLYIWWGKGKQDGSFFPMFENKGTWHWLTSVWTYGRIEVQFQQMKAKPPLDEQSKRQELLGRLNDIPGIDIPADGITRRPTIPLHVLKDDSALTQFLATLDWVMQVIRAA